MEIPPSFAGGKSLGPTPPTGSLTVAPGLVLDARRAAWFSEAGVLAIADTHLGYAWAERRRGQLLPVPADDTAARLEQLLQTYPTQTVVMVGDCVHQAAAMPVLATVLREFCHRITVGGRRLVGVLGNHDRELPARVRDWSLPMEVVPAFSIPGFHFVHGDQPLLRPPAGARIVSGHEHPSLSLGDGVATRAKVPAFLLGDRSLLLPAFSLWAAGTVAGTATFLGPVASAGQYTRAIACLGPRLLSLPFPSPWRVTRVRPGHEKPGAEGTDPG